MPRESSKCRIWAKERRDRLKQGFENLAKLLPCFDASLPLCKIDILRKSAEFIQDLQSKVNDVLTDNNAQRVQSSEIIKLQDRVNKLLTRNEQLCSLLKDAGISLPPFSGSAKKFKKAKPWSNKISPEQARILQQKEKDSRENIPKTAKAKRKVQNKLRISPKHKRVLVSKFDKNVIRKTDKKKGGNIKPSKCVIVYSQPSFSQSCYIITNAPSTLIPGTTASTVITPSNLMTSPLMSASVKSYSSPTVKANANISTLGPGTLILANGSVVPLLPPTPSIIQPITLVTQKSNNLIVVSKSSEKNPTSETKTTTSDAITLGKICPKILPKVKPRCATETTQVNKVPIPALTSKYATLCLKSVENKSEDSKAWDNKKQAASGKRGEKRKITTKTAKMAKVAKKVSNKDKVYTKIDSQSTSNVRHSDNKLCNNKSVEKLNNNAPCNTEGENINKKENQSSESASEAASQITNAVKQTQNEDFEKQDSLKQKETTQNDHIAQNKCAIQNQSLEQGKPESQNKFGSLYQAKDQYQAKSQNLSNGQNLQNQRESQNQAVSQNQLSNQNQMGSQNQIGSQNQAEHQNQLGNQNQMGSQNQAGSQSTVGNQIQEGNQNQLCQNKLARQSERLDQNGLANQNEHGSHLVLMKNNILADNNGHSILANHNALANHDALVNHDASGNLDGLSNRDTLVGPNVPVGHNSLADHNTLVKSNSLADHSALTEQGKSARKSEFAPAKEPGTDSGIQESPKLYHEKSTAVAQATEKLELTRPHEKTVNSTSATYSSNGANILFQDDGSNVKSVLSSEQVKAPFSSKNVQTSLESQKLKTLDLSLTHSELSNDIFSSLQVPPGCQNAESTSPTAAFLLAFPLVSSLTGVKVTEVMDEDNSESHRETPTLLQIGTMESSKPSEILTPNLLNLENLSFFSSKEMCGGFYAPFDTTTTAETIKTPMNEKEENNSTEKQPARPNTDNLKCMNNYNEQKVTGLQGNNLKNVNRSDFCDLSNINLKSAISNLQCDNLKSNVNANIRSGASNLTNFSFKISESLGVNPSAGNIRSGITDLSDISLKSALSTMESFQDGNLKNISNGSQIRSGMPNTSYKMTASARNPMQSDNLKINSSASARDERSSLSNLNYKSTELQKGPSSVGSQNLGYKNISVALNSSNTMVSHSMNSSKIDHFINVSQSYEPNKLKKAEQLVSKEATNQTYMQEPHYTLKYSENNTECVNNYNTRMHNNSERIFSTALPDCNRKKDDFANVSYNYSDFNNSYQNDCKQNTTTKADKLYTFNYDNYTEFRKVDPPNYYQVPNSFQKDKSIPKSSGELLSTTRPSINWMPLPDKSFTDYNVVSTDFRCDTYPSNSFSTAQQSYYNASTTYSTNVEEQRKSDLSFIGNNSIYQKGDMEENNFSWSPTKIPQILEQPQTSTSALPTLVGDLALGNTLYHELKGDKSIKEHKAKERRNKTNCDTHNFLSVSQLVDHNKAEVPAKTTTRRNSGSRAKSNQKTTKRPVKDHKENQTLTKAESKDNKSFGQENSDLFCDPNRRNTSKNYLAESLIGHQSQIDDSPRKPQQNFTVATTKNIPVPPFLSENIIPYFSHVDLQQDNFVPQSQSYQTFPHNFNTTSFQNNSYASNSFIQSSTMTTNYLCSNNSFQDIVPHDYNMPDNHFFPAQPKDSRTSVKPLKIDKTPQSFLSAGTNKKNRKKHTNDNLSTLTDFPFLPMPSSINSPILPEDFHSHSNFLPPPTTQIFPCKNPLYTKQSELPSSALLPLPPVTTRTGNQQLEVPPTSSNNVGTSLTNFNLSTIFPEINKGGVNDLYSDSNSRTKETKCGMMPFSTKNNFGFPDVGGYIPTS